MFSLYTGGRKKDYFIEDNSVSYTTSICQSDSTGEISLHEPCEIKYSRVDRLCVDTKGTKAKRIFLTEDDRDILDVFMGCDRYNDKMNREEGKFKSTFLPIETFYHPISQCPIYGNATGSVDLDLVNGRATIHVDFCLEYLYKKVNGVWEKVKDVDIVCFY